MAFSQNESWNDCCHHEDEITILQDKLMEVHNKLIDQLDVCKEQELKIIELNKRVTQTDSTSSHNFDTFNYQSFGHQSRPLQENQTSNYFNSINNQSSQSHQVKTELLQADLQAMRNKVLTEITDKNRLKEEMKELRANHKRTTAAQVKRYEGLEGLHTKLTAEYEHLSTRYDKMKRSSRVESEFERLSELLADAESKYLHEKEHNRQLQARCRDFEDTVSVSVSMSEKSSSSRGYGFADSKHSMGSNSAVQQQQEIQYLKSQIERANTQVDQVERQGGHQGRQERQERQGRQDGHKKRGFEQTKDLIRKLQETEHCVRKNRRANV